MCGIAGVFNLDGKYFPEDRLKKMSKAIAHRGPDSEGHYIKENIAFAHRRLSIIDTSDKASQPMHSKDNLWVIVYNGCIYNYPEIKQELKAKGHRFISHSDTEVIAEGLSAYGVEIFKRLNGMFAVAAWNTEEQALYLSRDRFGVKPLYYWFNGKSLAFASEIKAILKHPDYKKEINFSALNEYFTFQNLFSFQTLFKGVTLLPPANTVKIDKHSRFVKHNSWWDYDFTHPDEQMDFEEARKETIRLFKQAVQRQLISDVPVGSFLSGGMDSGSITAVASKHINPLSTFTCGFDMSKVTGVEANFDERRDAELLANYFKTEHYEQIVFAGDLRTSLPRVVYHLEDLKLGMSYPNYYISKLASKFVKVGLQGTGGDELFGGYPWRYYRIMGSVNQKEFLKRYYDYWQRLVPDTDKRSFFTGNVTQNIDLSEPQRIFERVFLFNDKLQYDSPEQHIQNSLYFEIKTFLSGLLLVGDKLSMANGIEERYPFLDNDLVNFVQKVPVRYKLGNLQQEIKRLDENQPQKQRYIESSEGKLLLRKAMEEFIPKEILERKKQGFSAPDESWYRGENADYVRDLLLHEKNLSAEFINPRYVSEIVDEHLNQRKNHRLLIWSLMNFEWWLRIFMDGEE
ncbi:MAG: asparagine synthase (glutamine-hydrolyzing) [Bacteroidales bacterium]